VLPNDKPALHVIDLTSEQPNPPRNDPAEHKITRGKTPALDRVFRRPVNTVDGIVIHQTAVSFGVTKDAVKAAGGDAVLAKHRRALGVAAHMTAFTTGYAVHAHPLDWYVYHANALNSRSVGIEVEGLFPGTMKNELMTPELEQAARDGLEYLVRRGRESGMPLKWIWAHRQSSLTRDNDPGEEIWRKIVLDFAISKLGLVPQSDFVSGGRTIPPEWKAVRSGGH
jgi:hypothetical protein